MPNFQKNTHQELVNIAEKQALEIERLTFYLDLNLIEERRKLVAKCNELSNENTRLKKDLADINSISNKYPELVRSVTGKVII